MKSIIVFLGLSNRGADRHRGPCKQTQFDCAVHGVRSSTLFRRKRRGKVLDVVSTAIPGGAAARNAPRMSGVHGGKLVCPRGHPLDPLVGRSEAEASKRILDPRSVGTPRSGVSTQKSGAVRASTDFNKMINFRFCNILPKRLGPGCHLNWFVGKFETACQINLLLYKILPFRTQGNLQCFVVLIQASLL